MSPHRERPSDDDVPGTRYFRDSDGEIVVDRREESASGRNILLWFALGLIFLTAVAAISTAISTRGDSNDLKDVVAQQEHDSQKADYNFRLSQRTGCAIGNELRAGLRGMVRDQIESAQSTPPELFPQIPEDEFERLIAERVEELRGIITDNFRDVNCEGRYPLLDDPDTDVDEAGT